MKFATLALLFIHATWLQAAGFPENILTLHEGKTVEVQVGEKTVSLSQETDAQSKKTYVLSFKRLKLEAHFITYLPGIGIVGWDEGPLTKVYKKETDDTRKDTPTTWTLVGNREGGFVKWVYREAGSGDIGSRQDEILFRRDVDESGFTSKRTFFGFGMRTSPSFTRPADQINQAYLFKGNELEKKWEKVVDLKKSNRTATFFQMDEKGHIQFADAKEGEKFVQVTTLSPNLEIKATHDAYLVHQAPDVPLPVDFLREKIAPATPDLLPYLYGRAQRWPEEYKTALLVADPKVENWFSVLNLAGELVLPKGALGLIPLAIEQQTSTFNKAKVSVAQGWVVAYGAKGGGVKWGWGSPELAKFTGPIWSDWDLHVDETLEKFEIYSRNTRVYMPMPLVVAQLGASKWQLYTLPNYYTFNSTFDGPNTFQGKIPSGKTKAEAIKKGVGKLMGMRSGVKNELDQGLRGVEKARIAASNKLFLKQEQHLKDKAKMEKEAARRQELVNREYGGISEGLSSNTSRQGHIRIMGDIGRKTQYLKSITR